MIARLWTTGIKPGRAEAYEAFAREISLPMFREQVGFGGCIMSRDGDSASVLTLWSGPEAVEALNTSTSYQTTVAATLAADLLAGDQRTDVSEVHLIEVPGP